MKCNLNTYFKTKIDTFVAAIPSPFCPKQCFPKPQNIEEIVNKKAVAFAGIGNPVNFFNLLRGENIDLLHEISFPDHYDYSEKELKNLITKAKNNNAVLLTTEKDYLRISENYRKNINFLKIKTIVKDKDRFINQIKKIT